VQPGRAADFDFLDRAQHTAGRHLLQSVAWSALDARRFGFEAAVIEDACRGIDLGGSLAKAWADMAAAGVKRIQSGQLA